MIATDPPAAPDAPPALAGRRRELDLPDAGRISWYEDAPSAAAARPLVLVHSVNAAGSAYEVKPLYDHYRQRRPVYAPDLPGFGLSGRAARIYTPRIMTDAVHAVVAAARRAHGGVAVDAIALSLGAEFLARAAIEDPHSYRSLGLVSPTGFNRLPLRQGVPGSTLGRAGVYRVIAAPWLGRSLFRLLTRRPVIRYFLRRTWGAPGIDEGLLDYDVAVTAQLGAEHAPLSFLSGYLFSGDSGTLYRGLAQPVWVAHGVRGDFVDYRGLRGLADRPNWQLQILQTGALPHFERLAEFVARFDAWQEQLESGTAARPATAA